MRFLPIIATVVLAMTACSSQSSSNGSGSSQASDQSSTASDQTSTASRGTSTDSIPEYPGAATEAAGTGSNMGESASGKLLTTADSFDKVYVWYQQHMPSGSEKSHITSPIDTAVFMLGDVSSGQKSVTITEQGGKTTITIADVKS